MEAAGKIIRSTLPAPPGPAGSDGRRSCRTCGAQHPPGARFCWRCYAPLVATARGAGTTGTTGTGTAIQTPPRLRFTLSETTPVRRRLGARIPGQLRTLVAVAGIVFLVAAIVRGSPYRMPESIGGLPRAVSPTSAAFEAQWRGALADGGIEGEVGLYGPLGRPDYLVVAFEARPASAADALARFDAAWRVGTNSPIALSSARSVRPGTAEMACAPFARGAFRTACVWVDAKGFVGAVLSFGAGMTETEQTAAAAEPALRA